MFEEDAATENCMACCELSLTMFCKLSGLTVKGKHACMRVYLIFHSFLFRFVLLSLLILF